jgi:parallel beta helix pectate lyase-like protein
VTKRLSVRVPLLAFLVLLLASAAAQAQATRTWVSGVGDDANPCSRTAPCKTFAGAISKTAPSGEINVLDPGGFGGVTITKSITISSEGFEAGVLVSGTNAIIINAGASDSVVLRGLDIEGLGTGLVGIKVLGGLGALHVEKCTINNFRGTNGSGIEVAPTVAGTMRFYVKDTIVRRNGQGTGGGIFVHPAAGVTVKGALDNVLLENNVFGLKVQDNSSVAVTNSTAGANINAGFAVVQVAGGPGELILDRCMSTGNGTFGLVAIGNATTIARIAGSTFTNNGTGIQAQVTSQIVSAGTNFINGNLAGGDGAPTSTPGTN